MNEKNSQESIKAPEAGNILALEHFEHRLLIWLMRQMDEAKIKELREKLIAHKDDREQSDSDAPSYHEYLLSCFDQILEEAQENADPLLDGAFLDWSGSIPADESHQHFIHLFNTHYKKWSKDIYTQVPGVTVSKSHDFAPLFGCDKNKFYRMLKEIGHENKRHIYSDNVRAICFVCHMTYLEAVEFLWAAQMPFSKTSDRDMVLADCLVKKIYTPAEVDSILKKNNQDKLFEPFDI